MQRGAVTTRQFAGAAATDQNVAVYSAEGRREATGNQPGKTRGWDKHRRVLSDQEGVNNRGCGTKSEIQRKELSTASTTSQQRPVTAWNRYAERASLNSNLLILCFI